VVVLHDGIEVEGIEQLPGSSRLLKNPTADGVLRI